MPGLGRGGGDSQNLRTFHANQGPIPRILHLRDQGSREADPTSSLLAHPAQRPAVTAGMLEGTQAWEEGRRSGDAACERGGAWGRGLGKARRGGAWPQRPRPAAAPQPGLLFRSPLGPDPRGSSGSGNRHPRTALPGPRATLSRSRRQSWSGCRIPAGPPHHSFLWLDIWTLGPAPPGFRKPSPPNSEAQPRTAFPPDSPTLTSVYSWTPASHPFPPA